MRAAVLGQRRFSVTPPSRASTRRPRSAYNSVVSRGRLGRRVRDRRVDLPARQARRPDDGARARPGDRRGRRASATRSARRAPRRARRSTRRCRPTAGSSPSRPPTPAATARRRENGLWVVDRRAGRERLVTDASRGAAYLPEVAGDGSAVVYTSAKLENGGLTHVYATSLETGRTTLVSRADGRSGAPAAGDAYEPSVSRDGRFVAFTSRAAQPRRRRARRRLRARPRGAARRGSSPARSRPTPARPSLSADGRYVAFVVRVGRPNGKPESLRSRVWRHDLRPAERRSSAAPPARAANPPTATPPTRRSPPTAARVAFATHGRQPRGDQAGRHRRRLRPRLRPRHHHAAQHARPAPGTGGVGLIVVAAPTGSGLALAAGGLLLVRRRRSSGSSTTGP